MLTPTPYDRVSFVDVQSRTDAEQLQARQNIGITITGALTGDASRDYFTAAGGEDMPDGGDAGGGIGIRISSGRGGDVGTFEDFQSGVAGNSGDIEIIVPRGGKNYSGFGGDQGIPGGFFVKVHDGSDEEESLNTIIHAASNKLSFFGSDPIAKPTVTGYRAGNAALISLLTALASYGLITDNSTNDNPL